MAPPWLQTLLDPGFYPHPVRSPIQLIQTHISYVFLTGDYAYKIKKPVNFGFLDFSTLADRQHFCQEELRLNQPVAPDIYLEVVTITESAGTWHLGGEGVAIEYTLKMNQFPQETLLSHCLEVGTLTEKHLQILGETVAHFHQNAPSTAYITGFGAPEKIQDAIAQNYQQTQAYVGDLLTQDCFQQIREFTDRYFTQHRDLFQARQTRGLIRECHGDLHLGNICFWRDKMQLFDRIEFNEPFRFVDVAYDLGFVVMDLQAKQRPDFALIFLNTYLEQTGDWQSLTLLPLYLCRQAYVRAKVHSLQRDQLTQDDPGRSVLAQQAQQYYQLAWRYTQPRSGRIFLMSGLSGSGKTTVARFLAQQFQAIHLRSDALRKHLAGIPLHQTGDSSLYTPAMTRQTYEQLLHWGIHLARQGYSVILDAKYDRQAQRQAVIAQAQQHRLPLQIFLCTAPEGVLRDRLLNRQNDISDATPDLLTSQQAATEPMTTAEQAWVTIVDTSQEDWRNTLAIA